jgi:predicted nucleic acid-binding protein
MKSFVFDSAPLIFLAKAGALNYLEKINNKKLIPLPVYDEVIAEGKKFGYSAALLRDEFVKKGMFESSELKNTGLMEHLSKVPNISESDAHAICLAKELDAVLILDDKKARLIAEVEGVECAGSAYIVFLLLKKSIISKTEAKQILERMIEAGWFCSTDLYVHILNELEKFR